MGDINIVNNVNPKRNPFTTVIGTLFLLVSLMMVMVKYIVPSFVELKQAVPYEGWHILIVVLVGVFLIFMNDNYFARIFSRVDQVAAKKTGTDDNSKAE
jgi:ABC-type Na+ efflux pump permease subunit